MVEIRGFTAKSLNISQNHPPKLQRVKIPQILPAFSPVSEVGGLARDILAQRGGQVTVPMEDAPAPPRAPPSSSAVLWQPPQAGSPKCFVSVLYSIYIVEL